MHKTTSSAMAFLMGAVMTASISFADEAAETALPTVPMKALVAVDDSIWSHVNWASFDQDKVVSYGGYQYSIYWDSDRTLALVRRNLQTDDVQTVRLEDYRLPSGEQSRNGHRNTVVGISAHDGRLHLSWDHHVNNLNYTRSREGLLTNPPETFSASDFEPRQAIMPQAPQRVTYPRFILDQEDNLYFMYRTGGSGSGNSVFLAYDASNRAWRAISTRLFGLEGVYPPWNNSSSRNAYAHDVLFDGNGRLHITWIYREEARTWASNHDLHYAYSDDQGRTWHNNAGKRIADTTKGEQITIDTPGIRVWEIPVYSWMMNQCSMALDANNNPHVATYHMEEPYRPERVGHGPPSHARDRLHYFHYWRDNDGKWHRSKPLPNPGVARPQIVCTPDDTVVIYFRTPNGFMAHVARATDRWSTWRTVQLTGPEITVIDITKPDRRRLQHENVLSFTVDNRGSKEERGYAFVDFAMEDIIKAAFPD